MCIVFTRIYNVLQDRVQQSWGEGVWSIQTTTLFKLDLIVSALPKHFFKSSIDRSIHWKPHVPARDRIIST